MRDGDDLVTVVDVPAPLAALGTTVQVPTVTDGETRQLLPGNVFRLEDTAPCKGHITVVSDRPGYLMFVR